MIFFGIKNRWTHLRKKHDKEKDLHNEAFLSKIQLGEKIIPCIIIVIYYEEHFWKGNKDLYDLFINTNEHVNNYSMRQVELCKDSTNYDNDEVDGSVLYSYEKGDIISFVYTNSDNGWYQIMSEAPVKDGKIDINSTYTKDSVGYIQASDLNQ